MISRRTLFARLSAVALAPLAKWLPKPAPAIKPTDVVGWKNYVFTMDPNSNVCRESYIVWHEDRLWLVSRDAPPKEVVTQITENSIDGTMTLHCSTEEA